MTSDNTANHEAVIAKDSRLNIDALLKLFSVMNQSYKVFWFRGILEGIRQGKDTQSFGEIVNRMIADAWEPVLKYHLRLGPADAVERLVKELYEESGLPEDADRKAILSALVVSSSSEISRLKIRLIQYVPYRLQTPFMKDEDWRYWDDYDLTTAKINSCSEMIYTIQRGKGLASTIKIRPEWMDYLTRNLDSVSAWADEQLLEYLRKQNPDAEFLRLMARPVAAVPVPERKTVEEPAEETSEEVREKPAAEPVAMVAEKKGRKGLTPRQKLWRRIKREFPRKKFIGDIQINDEEFELLVQELNIQHRRLMAQPEQFEADEVFCVALVQFGIRFYNDGSYWPFVEQRVNPGYFKVPHRTQFGNAFLDYMRRSGKLLNEEKKAMSNILLHGFVSDPKSDEMFDFLYAYYSIDLARDIDRLDRDAMNSLIGIIKTKDGSKGTYNLVEHTADAVRLNERGGKTRLRRYLKMIDRFFWNENEFSIHSQNRLMKRFAEWWIKDEEKIEKDRSAGGGRGFRRHGGWKPYLKYDFENDTFSLALPARLVSGEEEPDTYWVVRHGEKEEKIDVDTVAAVTGRLTEENELKLTLPEIFGAFEVGFFRDGERLGRWKIPADQIRFFETDGEFADPKTLRPGDVVSFSAPDYVPVSGMLYNTEEWNGYLRCSYLLEDGDVIVFPDKKVLNIGRKPTEGLLKRGLQSGVFGLKDEKRYPVYASAPSLFARILPKSMNGTQLRVNGKIYRLFEENVPVPGVLVFDLQERVPEEGVHIALNRFGVEENGLYHVELDIPNDYADRTRDFFLINGLQYSFDEAPYIFVETGILCVPEETGLAPYDPKIRAEHEDGQLRVVFAIPEEDEYYRLSLDGMPVAFEIPKLSYRFQGEETWRTKLQVSIWHKDLPEIVEIRYPADRLTILLDEEGNADDDDEQHSQNYTRNQEKGCFVCDLHPFRSWYGRRVAVRRLYVKLPEMKKPARFMNVYVKNVFVSAVLTMDRDNEIIRGEVDVIGKAPCCADLWFENELLLKKEPIVDGKITLFAEGLSGQYRIDVYDTDEDDDGFDEPDYELLASKSMELINPANLTGSHVEIKQLMRSGSDSYLRLKQSYTLYDLKALKEKGKGYYSAHVVVREKEYGKYRDDYPACIYIPDPEELSKGYLCMLDEYGDETFFVYDNDRALMRRYEDRSVRGVAKYRRYAYLDPDDYYCRLDFVEKPADMESRLEVERAERKLQLEGRAKSEEGKEHQRKLDPLCKPLRDTGLPIAIRNELANAGVLYTTDLKNMTMFDLNGIKGLNRTDIEQCIVALRRAGYKISMF